MACLFSVEYIWDTDASSVNILVVKEQPNVMMRKVVRQSTDAARGRTGVNRGRHVFRLEFDDKPWGSHKAVGLCNKYSQVHSMGEWSIVMCTDSV